MRALLLSALFLSTVACVAADIIPSGSPWRVVSGDAAPLSPTRSWFDAHFGAGGWPVLGFPIVLPTASITAYARHTFVLSEGATTVTAAVYAADGFVAHVNGVEVHREAMPEASRHEDEAEDKGGVEVTLPEPGSTLAASASEARWVEFTVPAGVFLRGTNVVAVEVHRAAPETPPQGAPFDCVLTVLDGDGRPLEAVVGLATAPSVVRGPYLTALSSHSVLVRWRTATATTSRVFYGVDSTGEFSADSETGDAVTDHAVQLEGLLAHTVYTYAVGTAESSEAFLSSSRMTFETFPAAGWPHSTRILLLGDAGSGYTEQVTVRDAFREYTALQPPQFVALLGDNAYNSATDTELQNKLFSVYEDDLLHLPVVAVFGNHDAYGSNAVTSRGPFFDAFQQFSNGWGGGAATDSDSFFSFDCGTLHVVVLDTAEYEMPKQTSWLAADLAAAADHSTFLVAMFHHPVYSDGSHVSDTENRLVRARNTFLPILEAGGVDLVLSGHSHSYERTMLLDSHYGTSTTLTDANVVDGGDGSPASDGAYVKPWGLVSNKGTVSISMGNGGKVDTGSNLRYAHPAVKKVVRQPGFTVLDLTPSAMDVRMVDSTGSVWDHFRIAKEAPEYTSPLPSPSGRPWVPGSVTPSTTPPPSPTRTRTPSAIWPSRTGTPSPVPSSSTSSTPVVTPSASRSPSTPAGAISTACACDSCTSPCCTVGQVRAMGCGSDGVSSATIAVVVCGVVLVGAVAGIATYAWRTREATPQDKPLSVPDSIRVVASTPTVDDPPRGSPPMLPMRSGTPARPTSRTVPSAQGAAKEAAKRTRRRRRQHHRPRTPASPPPVPLEPVGDDLPLDAGISPPPMPMGHKPPRPKPERASKPNAHRRPPPVPVQGFQVHISDEFGNFA